MIKRALKHRINCFSDLRRLQVQGKLSMGSMGSENSLVEMREQHDAWQAVVKKLNSEAESRHARTPAHFDRA